MHFYSYLSAITSSSASRENVTAEWNHANGASQLICAEQALYITGTICLKISLAFFFLRFLITPWSRHIIWISVTIYTTLATAMLFLVIFECGLPTNYVLKQASHQCVSFRVQSCVGYAHGAVNALTDWLFPVLAITHLARTKLSPMAKVSCAAILGLAVCGSIASIVRTIYIPDFGPGGNIYSKTMKPLVWTLVEGGLGIVAASLATLRPLFRTCWSRTKGVYQGKSTGERSTSKYGKSSLGSTLNCFGSTSPVLAELPQESEEEKGVSTMDLESGNHPETTTRPLHLGILSSVATDTELNTKMDRTRTTIRGLESAL